VHLRVEPAHFDWRWRERPALALLAWEALARDPLARLRRIRVESTGTKLILGQRLSPIATSAASALLIALRHPVRRMPLRRVLHAKAAREGLAIVAGIIQTMTGAGGGLD
jgi:hypothetical protein